ncbi:glycosyltransferase family 2 protein [Thermodesulfobacteriota bacterium]
MASREELEQAAALPSLSVEMYERMGKDRMSGPLVSIVLPTYNGERYLADAVESCVEQTYDKWELIIVDDASKDRTPDIIAAYVKKDSRIRSFRHRENCKLPAALNTGFAHARGDLLTWTSDDNLYREEALSVMVEHLDNNPSVDIVYCDFSLIDDSGDLIGHVVNREPDRLSYGNCCGACFLYRVSVQEALGGYNEDLFLAEDYDFWLRASATFTLHHLSCDLYLSRVHPDSLSSTQADGRDRPENHQPPITCEKYVSAQPVGMGRHPESLPAGLDRAREP